MKIAFWASAAALVLSPIAAPVAAYAQQSAGKKAATKTADLRCDTTTASGLSYTILKAGAGDAPGADDSVKVNYRGRLAKDGTQFDAGQGANFPVSGVIAGFAEGLQLMQPGAKFRFCIPAALGYGDQDKGTIPPASDLVFEVDLIEVNKAAAPVVQIIPETERQCEMTTASGMGYKELNSGLGNAPTDEDVALVNYRVYRPDTGQVMDASDWLQIPLAQASTAIGEALKLMTIGSSYRFCIPGAMLGQPPKEDGTPPPPVNFHIDLVDVKKSSELR
ncbi:FKBP-type peptidyl-prolyl cis-trans isomerase [Sphingorhabdus arenilitoris]|uniref:Peptidyl-prolyl cis-trans isomerase n=1 Tax=Sphingorhabdus arenilitoris TaxID=1490041 RepID=A0ABV8RI74_9SPHN